MRRLVYLAIPLVMLGCKTKTPSGTEAASSKPYVGKLVVLELCNHFVVELESGDIDTSKLALNWRDEKRNATYPKSFAVASSCSFATSGLKEGDRFTFELADGAQENCAVCMAYYPTPDKKLSIKNISKITP
ncbi:hypothetical protein [Flavihumibacter petaseus]|uniref:Lipoprotein n=1 Tax=Flavihumibacter petaseus NBRC 106054 TaxID=1220578 RepID=A0A0E9MVS3_9BACT|nr:hypothetical protein [Flavihumibacter petaseus]GAO41225.1 hypothetical protein FPE01S_01_02370 [Flavihumibacter petaseus NBRC 106054]